MTKGIVVVLGFCPGWKRALFIGCVDRYEGDMHSVDTE